MILLQAAIAGGMVLYVILLLLSVIVVPLLTWLFMRKLRSKPNLVDEKQHTKPVAFFFALVSAIIITGILFVLFILLLDRIFPGYGYSN